MSFVNKISSRLLKFHFLLQENVGGTTYFYQASGSVQDNSHSSNDSLQHVTHMDNSGGSVTYHVYPGTPSNLVRKIHDAPSTSAVAEDMRVEIMNKNALTLLQPEPEQFPGKQETYLHLF